MKERKPLVFDDEKPRQVLTAYEEQLRSIWIFCVDRKVNALACHRHSQGICSLKEMNVECGKKKETLLDECIGCTIWLSQVEETLLPKKKVRKSLF